MDTNAETMEDGGTIERILGIEGECLGRVERVEALCGGYSSDRKYALWQGGKPVYLLRLAGIAERERCAEEFRWIGRHHANGVFCPQTFAFGATEDACYALLQYLPGETLADALPRLSEQAQVGVGTRAGRELRRMHEAAGAETGAQWMERRWRKHQRYVGKVQECGLGFTGEEAVQRYIESRWGLLEGRPVRFQHDDFHPANLILHEGRFGGVIDFNRFDWGDPYEEFYKVPWLTVPLSPAFARGQVLGYFDGPPPDAFWPLYNLFTALSIFGSLGWAAMMGPEELRFFQERTATVLQTHDFIHGGPPAWFAGRP